MDEAAIENALTAWVAAATGLPADGSPVGKILWVDQNQPRPDVPWISLNLHIVKPVGVDGVTYTVDGTSNGHDGHELVATATGLRQARLSIQCFAGAGTGVSSARGFLNKIVAARRLPSVAAALRAGGVGVARFGHVVSLGLAIEGDTVFEPRAQLEVFLNLVSQVTEAATEIDTVNAGVKVHNAAGADIPSLDFTATA